MKNIPILLVFFFLTGGIFSQSENKILQGEMTINHDLIKNLNVGDTLVLMIAKKHYVGSILIHSDNVIYEWSLCKLGQKKYSWCKIGTWKMNENLVLDLNGKTIVLDLISTANEQGKQELIILDVN